MPAADTSAADPADWVQSGPVDPGAFVAPLHDNLAYLPLLVNQPNHKESAASVQAHLAERMVVDVQLAAVLVPAADLEAMLLLVGGLAACSKAPLGRICL